MTRRITRQLRNSKHPTIEVTNNMGGLVSTGTKYGIRKNAYVDCNNIILSKRGGFKRRKTAVPLGVEPDGDLSRVYGIGYQKDFGYIRVKGDKIQTLANPAATWATIVSGYTITGSNFIDFVEFKATSLSGAIIDTIVDPSSERFLKMTTAMTPNEYIGKLLEIGTETKLIIGNTSTHIFIQEKFEGEYVALTSVNIVDQVTAVYIITPGQNVKIWRGGASIQTLGFSFDRAVLQSYGGLRNNGRLFCIKNDGKVYVSEVGSGEYFQKDSFLPINVKGDLIGISNISGRIVVYSSFGRVSVVGDNPDNFQVIPNLSNKGALSAGSIATGNNIEYYLSHEGIEFLNSVEGATVTEGISLSDNIKKKFQSHTDFTKSQGAISNGKYFLNIEGIVYIYDLELSVKFHKPIFTVASYDECSQTIVSNAVAGEWTCAKDINGQLVFGQGGIVNIVSDEKIGAEEVQAQLKYMIEFPIEYMKDIRIDKAVQKYRLFLQNNKTLLDARTNVKIYLNKNEEGYNLVNNVENVFEIETFLSEKVKSISFKVEIEDLDAEVDTEIEFLYSELQFYFLNKR